MANIRSKLILVKNKREDITMSNGKYKMDKILLTKEK